MQQLNAKPMDVIQSMTHQDLLLYKKKNSKASIPDRVAYDTYMQDQHKTGVVFVSPSKADLTDGKGVVITSYEALEEKYAQLSHWTPNIFRGGRYYDFRRKYMKGHEKENLKQINVIGFDIDTKKVDLYSLFLACDELGLPRPNVLLETPKGYQGFFVLETPFYIHKKENYKALRVADRVASNMIDALSEYAPIDRHCAPFGFYRIPNDDNLLYFDDDKIHTASLIDWSMNYEREMKKKSFHVIYGGKHSSEGQHVTSDWYKALIQTTAIKEGEYASSRNNALLTLALANYADGIPYEQAFDALDQWNSALVQPLPFREFKRTLKSAYSGKYKGVKRSYAEALLENWTDGNITFSGQNGWYKFAKSREDRERSHYKEWEQDIIEYLNAHTTAEKPVIECSLRMLADKLSIPLSTLKEVLKRSKYLYKKSIGRGRAAKTILGNKSILFEHLLLIKRNKEQSHMQLLFEELFPQLQDQKEKKEITSHAIFRRDTS